MAALIQLQTERFDSESYSAFWRSGMASETGKMGPDVKAYQLSRSDCKLWAALIRNPDMQHCISSCDEAVESTQQVASEYLCWPHCGSP